MNDFQLFLVILSASGLIYLIGRLDGRRAERREMPKALPVTPQDLTSRPREVVPFKAPVQIGQRFQYLDVEMLCTQHVFSLPMIGLMLRGVKAEYVDKDGRIQAAHFMESEMPALKAELERESIHQNAPTGQQPGETT